MIQLNEKRIKNVYALGKQLSKVYQGDKLVWEKETPKDIDIKIVDEHNVPIEGSPYLTVTVGDQTKEVGSDGTVHFDGIKAGTYKVSYWGDYNIYGTVSAPVSSSSNVVKFNRYLPDICYHTPAANYRAFIRIYPYKNGQNQGKFTFNPVYTPSSIHFTINGDDHGSGGELLPPSTFSKFGDYYLIDFSSQVSLKNITGEPSWTIAAPLCINGAKYPSSTVAWNFHSPGTATQYLTDLEAIWKNTLDNVQDSDGFQIKFPSLFQDCSNLSYIHPEAFNQLTKMVQAKAMFKGCTRLRKVDSIFSKNTQLLDCNEIFSGCTNLESVPEDLFDNCSPNLQISSAFIGTKLKEFYFPIQMSVLPNTLFGKSEYLTDIYFRNTMPPHIDEASQQSNPVLLEANAIGGAINDFKKHVPASALEAYRTAWANYEGMTDNLIGDL